MATAIRTRGVASGLAEDALERARRARGVPDVSMAMNAAGTGLDQVAPPPKMTTQGSTWSPMTSPGAGSPYGGYGASPSPGGYPTQPPEAPRQIQPPDAGIVPGAPPSAPTFARIPPPGVEDPTGAENAAFGRAHGRIGQLARGSIMATRDEFNGRGLAGSRSEGQAVQGVISDAANQNADVIATQAVEGLRRQQNVNDRNYAGEIGQRGADIGYASTTRGQDIGAADSRAAAKGRLDALRRMAATGARY